jgi:hypothetical protein
LESDKIYSKYLDGPSDEKGPENITGSSTESSPEITASADDDATESVGPSMLKLRLKVLSKEAAIENNYLDYQDGLYGSDDSGVSGRSDSSEDQDDSDYQGVSANLSFPRVRTVKKRRGPATIDSRAVKRARGLVASKTQDPFSAAMQDASERYRQNESEKLKLLQNMAELEEVVQKMTNAHDPSQQKYEELEAKHRTLENQLGEERE